MLNYPYITYTNLCANPTKDKISYLMETPWEVLGDVPFNIQRLLLHCGDGTNLELIVKNGDFVGFFSISYNTLNLIEIDPYHRNMGIFTDLLPSIRHLFNKVYCTSDMKPFWEKMGIQTIHY